MDGGRRGGGPLHMLRRGMAGGRRGPWGGGGSAPHAKEGEWPGEEGGPWGPLHMLRVLLSSTAKTERFCQSHIHEPAVPGHHTEGSRWRQLGHHTEGESIASIRSLHRGESMASIRSLHRGESIASIRSPHRGESIASVRSPHRGESIASIRSLHRGESIAPLTYTIRPSLINLHEDVLLPGTRFSHGFEDSESRALLRTLPCRFKKRWFEIRNQKFRSIFMRVGAHAAIK